MENPQQLLIETTFQDLILTIRPNENHEWLMETKLVAEGYGVDETTIRYHKSKNADEFIEGKHYLYVSNTHAQIMGFKLGSMVREQTFWTKRGVVRLGFFIKSARAKLFRDWVEDLIINELNKNNQPDKIDLLEAKMHQYLDALHKIFSKHIQEIKKESKETRELIHNLSNRVDKLEKYLLFPHHIEEKKSYTYVFRKIGTNEYKIGKSDKPLDKVQAFENAAGKNLKLILAIKFPSPSMALLWERTLQKTLEHLNLRGEWFLLTTKEVQLLLNISTAFEEFYLHS